MPPIPFALTFYKHKSAPLSSQRVVNWFAEEAQADAKTPAVLLQRPGLAPFAPNVGLGPMRGTREMAGVLYAVSGANLFSVDPSGIATDLGMIGTNTTGLVSMSDNGFELVVINDNDGWIFNKDTDTLTKISDPDFPKVTAVTYLDGYFIFTVLNSDQFIISALRDGTSYDALDFATAEGDPDLLVTLTADKRQLFLFGTDTIEPWFNSAEVFPFDRISGGYLETGIFARDSVAQVDNTIFWVDSDKNVVRLEGLTVARRVSTNAIDQALAGFSNLADARAFTLTFEGHAFYVLTIPEEATLAYDAATGLWHEWETFGQKAFNGCCHIKAYGHDLICDENAGAIYIIDPDTFRDANGIAASPPMGTGEAIGEHQNDIPNNKMQGAVVGTLGAGGALPTGWLLNNNTGNFMVEVVSIGIDSGVEYIDIRYHSPTAVGTVNIDLMPQPGIAAVLSDDRALSAYVALESGSKTNISEVILSHAFRNSVPTFLSSNQFNFVAALAAGALKDHRHSFTDTVDEATAAWSLPIIKLSNSAITTPDITLRIGLPTDEPTTAATPPVRTSGTASSRPAGIFVEGAGQTGNSVKLGGLKPETSGLLNGGDKIAIGRVVYTLTTDLPTSDITGEAIASILPALVTSPADAQAVTVGDYLPIVRDAIGAPLYARGRRIAMPEFEAIFETGVGLTNGQGTDPQAKLSFSNDGGRSWSNAVGRSMGKIGEYQSRCLWRRLGSFVERTPRITVSDPVRSTLLGANAEVRGEIRGQPTDG